MRDIPLTRVAYGEAMGRLWTQATRGFRYSWRTFRPYMVNSLFVSAVSAFSMALR